MIGVRREPTIAILDGPTSSGGKERTRAIAFYATAGNRDKAFKFNAYSHDDVKNALNRLFHFKCAYCESAYLATQPVDVEHYRPKGGVVVNGALAKPGYYWLAADWLNLLPSCIDCNRERTQTFADTEPHLSGKANKFPIANEAKRATAPDLERHEERLLLHPYFDEPDKHLEFVDDGLVRPRRSPSGRLSRKGRVSIKVYGLLRDGLVRAREERWRQVTHSVTQVARWSRQFDAHPDDADIAAALADELSLLKAYVQPQARYSAMARQTASRVASMVGVDLSPIGIT